MAILNIRQIYFKTKIVIKHREYSIVIKGSIHEGNITVINVYT